jgi:hypothetical protein
MIKFGELDTLPNSVLFENLAQGLPCERLECVMVPCGVLACGSV